MNPENIYPRTGDLQTVYLEKRYHRSQYHRRQLHHLQ